MQTITQREFRNDSAAIMDSVEHGETYVITRNGVEVAEVRPRSHRRKVTAAELVERHRKMTPGNGLVAESESRGILDTYAYIDLGTINPERLPDIPELTAITMTELHQGVAMARTAEQRIGRLEKTQRGDR
ncbi:type II toxin-antitoxin system prevent-host-death family antitoxin [Glycomyces sp. NEAU-S30]|uniref:Antitoxin n=1 Tax=Glycomyces niveus TaxID=2820287 RepID=A0ABS3U778_9ACTN|nr:type II toxin-antitoxin system prevent-host-death family antitoxin [Glycomyces sp. NEAU-S30]MBO3734635.1 type II toxin-antitoxin system prevent-host-death family antitoxin [Glycomyces sp. NEAU-S30]